MSQTTTKSTNRLIVAPPARVLGDLTPPARVEVSPKIWRVGEAELEGLCEASVPFFLERYPRLNVERTVSYVRSALHENRSRVIRTENAWAMATINQTFFEPEPVVYEIFMCSFKKNANDIVWLAKDLVKWAESVRAVEYRMGSATEYDVAPLARRIGADKKQTVFIKKIGV